MTRLRMMQLMMPTRGVVLEGSIEDLDDLLQDAVVLTHMTYRTKELAEAAADKCLRELCGTSPVVVPFKDPDTQQKWLCRWLA